LDLHSCGTEEYSLAQLGFQEFKMTNANEITKEEIQEIEELLKETFNRSTSTSYFQPKQV
jgi:hypothetical protein